MSDRIKYARAHSSGTMVEVWRPSTISDDPGWFTVCEHSSLCSHPTRKLALYWSAAPQEWCETGCRHAAYQREGCATCTGPLQWADDAWVCTKCGDEFSCPCYDCEVR